MPLLARRVVEGGMSNMTYAQQLRHPNWQRRRLEILSRSEFSCEYCGDSETTLNVHHVEYKKGRKAWDYGDDELEALCERCHKERHAAQDAIKHLLAHDKGEVFGILAGYFAGIADDEVCNALRKAGCGDAVLVGLRARGRESWPVNG